MRTQKRVASIWWLAAFIAVGACDCDDEDPVDAGPDTMEDGGVDATPDTMADTAPDVPDTGSTCTGALDCDDGLFCNGVETCAPGTLGADARGCVASAFGPCEEGEACDEATRTCMSDPDPVSMIRAIHLSQDAPAVDIFANDDPAAIVSALEFPNSTDYLTVAPGTYDLDIAPAGTDPSMSVLAVDGLALNEDTKYTAVALNDLESIQALALVDEDSDIPDGSARVRVVHAAAGVDQVDIWDVTDPDAPAPLVPDLDFAASSSTLDLPAGTYSVGIDVDNDMTPDLMYDLPALTSGLYVNLFAVADSDGVFLLAQLPGGTTVRIDPRAPMTPVGQVRAIHLTQDAPLVDVYANEEEPPAFLALEFTNSSPYITLEAGEYTFDVAPGDTDPTMSVLTLEGVQVEEGDKYTAIAFNDLADIQGLVLEDDSDGLDEANVRIRAIHTAVGVGQVDIWNVTDPDAPAALVSDLDFGAASDTLDVPAGAYSLGVDVDDDLVPDLTFDLPALTAGAFINVFAVADSAGAFLLAQLPDGTTLRIDPTLPPEPMTAMVRAIHLSQDAPGVDVFANDATPAVFTNLEFTDSSMYATVDAATYDFDIAPTGTDPMMSVLAIDDLELMDGKAYTAVAFDDLASIQALALEDDSTGLAATDVRIRAIHTAAGVGQVDIWNITDPAAPAALVTDLDFGAASATLDVTAGTYSLGIDADDDMVPDFTFDLPALAAGLYVNVFAVADAAGPFLLAQLPDGTTLRIEPTPPPASQLRAIHLSQDAPAVDVFANDATPAVFTNLAFTDSSAYATVDPGTYDLDIAPTGTDPMMSVLAVDDVELMDGSSYTAVAFNDLGSIQALALVDNASGIAAGDVRLRVIHTAAGVGQVDVWNVTDPAAPAALVTDLDFASASPTIDVPAAAYSVGIDVDDDMSPDLTFDLPTLTAGAYVNVFAVADAAGPFLLAQLPDGTTVRVDPTPVVMMPMTNVRAIHLSQDAPGVDVFANDATPAVFTNLEFTDGSAYATVPAGTYDFDIAPTGTDPTMTVLAVDDVVLGDGQSHTVVAFNDLGSIQALAIEDDSNGIAAGFVRVRAIHTAAGVGQVDIWNVTAGTPAAALVTDLDFGSASAALDIPAGSYSLGIDVDDDATPDLTFDLPSLPAGAFINVFAVADSSGAFLLAQLPDGSTLRVNPTPPMMGGDGTVRVLHLSSDAPAVDVFVNGAAPAVVNSLAFRNSSPKLTVPAGMYDFNVAPAGAGPGGSVLDVNATVAAGTDYTVVAFDQVASIQSMTLVDSTAGLAAGNIRLRVAHTASGIGQVDVWNITAGTPAAPLVTDLDFGSVSADLDVPAGAYSVGIDVDNDATPDVSYDLPALPAGTQATVYALNVSGLTYLLVHLPDNSTPRIFPR